MDKVISRAPGRPRRYAQGKELRIMLRCTEHEHAMVRELARVLDTSMNAALLSAVESVLDSFSRRAARAAKQSSAA